MRRRVAHDRGNRESDGSGNRGPEMGRLSQVAALGTACCRVAGYLANHDTRHVTNFEQRSLRAVQIGPDRPALTGQSA